MYSADSFEATSFVTRLSEVEEEEFYGIEMACDAIPIQQENCINHPASCQSTRITVSNFENTIRKRSQSLYSIKRVCVPSSFALSEVIIEKCRQGIEWNPSKNATEKFSFLSSMFEGFTRDYLEQEMSE